MTEQSYETEQLHEAENTVQSKETIKAEMVEWQTNGTENETKKSLVESALLDLTRSVLGSSLDDISQQLPAEKKEWLENIKKALDLQVEQVEQVEEEETKKNTLDMKFNLLRIEVAREVSRIDKANEAGHASPARPEEENPETADKEKPKIKRKYTPLNLGQVLLRRTLV